MKDSKNSLTGAAPECDDNDKTESLAEADSLVRYARALMKLPEDERAKKVDAVPPESLRRCFSESAPLELVQIFSRRANEVIDRDFSAFELGRISVCKGDLTAALESYRIALSQGESRAHYELGLIYQALGDYPAAAQQYEKAISHDSRGAESANQLGVMHYENDDPKQALFYFHMAISLLESENGIDNRCMKKVLYNLGRIYLEEGDKEKAVDYLSRGADIGELKCITKLIQIFSQSGNTRELARMLERMEECGMPVDRRFTDIIVDATRQVN